jgi:hypothetical protein
MSSSRWDPRKPRSHAHKVVNRAAREQKQNHGGVGTETVLGAARRSSQRAKGPKEMEIVQTTLQQVDVTTQGRLVDWVNRENPVDVLRDEIDPQYAQQYAVQTHALRTDRPLEHVTAAVAESEAGAAANIASRKAGARKKRKEGYQKAWSEQYIDGAGKVKVRKRTTVMTGDEVSKRAQRCSELNNMPAEERPSYGSQTTIGHGFRRFAGKKKPGEKPYVRPEGVRSLAEIGAGALRVTPIGGNCQGRYRMKIPKLMWSDADLVRMGFRPRAKPKRAFDFSGPTAEDDARAFDKKLMGWLKKWKKGAGPPPQPPQKP